MYTPDALKDVHERAHRSLQTLLTHCRTLGPGALDREFPGIGHPSVRLQLHHEIGAEAYWVGVLQGRVEADDDAHRHPTVETLEAFRAQTYDATQARYRRCAGSWETRSDDSTSR